MYAVIKTGGKQYRVAAGDVIQVEKLDAKLGSQLDLKEVLLVGGDTPLIGKPLVANALVTAVVTKQAKTRKQIVFKKKRRQSFRKFKTHKQMFTELFVLSITLPDGKVTKATTEPHISDVAQEREERLAERSRATRRAEGTLKAVRGAASTTDDEAKPKARAAAKGATKKKVAKKTAKKVAKKATKKVAKKK